MEKSIQDKDLRDIAEKAARHAHKEGMSKSEAHQHIYDEVEDANEGKPHTAAVAHGKRHYAKVCSMKEENLQEFASSDGISHTADPIDKDGHKGRDADKTSGGQEAMPQFATKAEAINALMAHVTGMPKEKIGDIFKGLTDNNFNHDHSKSKRPKDNDSVSQSIAQTHISPTSAKGSTAATIAAEDLDIMFGGEELSEEVREKARTIFEAAVNSRLYAEVARIEEEFEANLVEALSDKIEQLSENVDKYLSYAVEQWVADNEIAIESGLKAEVVEGFIHGLKDLFEQNYVDIPDDKVDVVEELSQQVIDLEATINSVVKENVELKDYVDSLEVDRVFAEAVDSLPLTQQEKLRSLVEGIEYSDVTEFTKKLGVIKETYFPTSGEKKTVALTEATDYDSDEDTFTEVPGPMSVYMKAISQSSKK
jgi:hypothetical protein